MKGVYHLPSLEDRIKAIEESGKPITPRDAKFVASLKGLGFGSPRQREILSEIEIRVLGRSEYAEISKKSWDESQAA